MRNVTTLKQRKVAVIYMITAIFRMHLQ